MLIMSLLIANDKHGGNDNYIFTADTVFVDNMAIILQDTSTGKEAFKQLSAGDLMYLHIFINSPAVKNVIYKEGDVK